MQIQKHPGFQQAENNRFWQRDDHKFTTPSARGNTPNVILSASLHLIRHNGTHHPFWIDIGSNVDSQRYKSIVINHPQSPQTL